MPEARLRHYNQVLTDQANALEAEVRERAAVFRGEFHLTTREVTPHSADQALTLRIAQARACLEQSKRDSARLDDPRQRRAVLDELPEPEEDAPDFEVLTLLSAILRPPLRTPRASGRRRKQRRG